MNTGYVRFRPPHLLPEYEGMPGYEIGNLALSPMGLAALAAEKARGEREMVVIGQWRYPDGRFYLDLGVTTAYIESASNYLYDDNQHRLRLYCRECDRWDGNHGRTCDRR